MKERAGLSTFVFYCILLVLGRCWVGLEGMHALREFFELGIGVKRQGMEWIGLDLNGLIPGILR